VDPSVGFLLNRTCVQVQIEWLQSTILFQATYHPFDDITRIQSYQMRLVNVCFIKIRSKHSSNTLLSLLRMFMKQTLHKFIYALFEQNSSEFDDITRIQSYQMRLVT
jgi:hypothetical protein